MTDPYERIFAYLADYHDHGRTAFHTLCDDMTVFEHFELIDAFTTILLALIPDNHFAMGLATIRIRTLRERARQCGAQRLRAAYLAGELDPNSAVFAVVRDVVAS